MTKATLYSDVKNLMDRQDITDQQLDTSVLLVEENMSRELRPTILQTYVEFPVQDNLLALPSDLLELKLIVREDNTPLRGRRDSTSVLNDYKYNSSCPATSFARIAGNLVFNGNVGNVVRIEYHQTPSSLLSGDAVELEKAERLLNFSPNYYLYGVAFHTAQRFAQEMADNFQVLYASAANAIQQHTSRADWEGGVILQDNSDLLTGT